jgi:hypothetical protein
LVRWVSEEHTWEDKKTLLQLFIVYAVPPDGIQGKARYTLPFTLGTKPKDHHPQLIQILQQTNELQRVTYRLCNNSNSCL